MVNLSDADIVNSIRYAERLQSMMDVLDKFDVRFRMEPLINAIIFEKFDGSRVYSKSYSMNQLLDSYASGYTNFEALAKAFSEEADVFFGIKK